ADPRWLSYALSFQDAISEVDEGGGPKRETRKREPHEEIEEREPTVYVIDESSGEPDGAIMNNHYMSGEEIRAHTEDNLAAILNADWKAATGGELTTEQLAF
mgnify:CR=1